jgi:rhodanese-related sulfurtransferase
MKQLTGRDLLALQAQAQATQTPAPLLLDVREPWEFAFASIRVEGLRTLHIPMNEIPGRVAELESAAPVVCICHHGVRSAQVVSFLEHQGFDVVYNLAGGIAAWSDEIDPGVPRY